VKGYSSLLLKIAAVMNLFQVPKEISSCNRKKYRLINKTFTSLKSFSCVYGKAAPVETGTTHRLKQVK
jgi:hypothetical protein